MPKVYPSKAARKKVRPPKAAVLERRDATGDRARVVVKFRDEIRLPYRDGIDEQLEKLKIGPWSRLVKEFPRITLRRLFTALKPEAIRALADRAAQADPTYRPVNLLGYFWVDAPAGTDLNALAKAFSFWPAVQTAYVDRPGPDPIVNAADDPRSPNQGYLDPAPDGIDAEYAWGFAGGDGAGQRMIDMERGWTLDHEDLVAHGATLLHGVLLDGSRNHGTSVLGEICAVDNTLGCVGLVPNLAAVNVVSYNGSTRPDAMTAAIANLSFGDVLLLEAQVVADGASLLGPIEVLDADFDVIRLATALGIIVVEAGGNGTNNGFPPPLTESCINNAIIGAEEYGTYAQTERWR